MDNYNQGLIRLQKEYEAYSKDLNHQITHLGKVTDKFIVVPSEDMFKWYFIVFGLGYEYEGGVYIGSLEFPKNYPWAPPVTRMLTESGQFEVNAEIDLELACRFYMQEWNPMWRGTKIIQCLIDLFPYNVKR